MTWAYVGAAAITTAGSLYSNSQNKKGAAAQGAAAQQGMDAIQGYYDKSAANLQPYMNTGIQANTGLQAMLNGDYSGFWNSPDYLAARQGGVDMLDRSAAARGNLFSGGHQRDLDSFGQQLASQYLGNHRNFLGGMADMGVRSATALGSFGADAGNSIAKLYGGAGDARASSYQANGMNGAQLAGGLGSMFGSKFGQTGGGGAGISQVGMPSQPMFQNNTSMPSLYGPPQLRY